MALSTINAAVHRQDSSRKEAMLDRLFALWFTRFVYNQIWEDPAVDLAALMIDSASRVVTIASGGCNVLNYLAANPAEIVAVDLNPAHIALTRLKIGALQHLHDYESFFRFFGIARDRANVALYDAHLRAQLDDATRDF
jgi:S-adenosylmethionine-diacylglycerol 3-amino-3-carboxypropyl transferase